MNYSKSAVVAAAIAIGLGGNVLSAATPVRSGPVSAWGLSENCACDLCRRAREESVAQQPSSGIRLVPRIPRDSSARDAAVLAN